MGRTKGRMAGIPGIRPESTTEEIKAIMEARNKTTTRARKLERNRKAQASRTAARVRDQEARKAREDARSKRPAKALTGDVLGPSWFDQSSHRTAWEAAANAARAMD